MNCRIEIRCRLAALLEEKQVTQEELSAMTGLSPERIREYCEGAPESVLLAELSVMLSALDCCRVTDILEESVLSDRAEATDDAPPMLETEWYSTCADSPDGRHRWYKDLRVSDTVYQEFCCQVCKRRLSVIL